MVPKGESVAARRERTRRGSLLWQRGLDEIGPTPEHATWIAVCDRGADIVESLQPLRDRRRRFVVRSTHNRVPGSGPTDEKADHRLHDTLRATPAQAGWDWTLPTKTGQPGRVAHLNATALAVGLRPPQVRTGHHRRESVAAFGGRVWDANPPDGVGALEWLLLTGEGVQTPEQVGQVAGWSACRMQVEEFHEVQKSGVSVEGCRVQDVETMAALVAVLGVVSVGLTNRRLAIRDPATATRPAGEVVPRVWVAVLSVYQRGRVMERTVEPFRVQLARLGGYQQDPTTNPPGWIPLWSGWQTLHPVIRDENRSRPKLS